MNLFDGSAVEDAASDAYDAAAGYHDWMAGDVDESVARQFDDEAGGGFADIALGVEEEGAATLGESVVAGGDHFSGSTDEAWDRQFDDTSGGGTFDMALGMEEQGAPTIEDAAEDAGEAAADAANAANDAAEDAAKSVAIEWWWLIALVLVGLFAYSDSPVPTGGN